MVWVRDGLGTRWSGYEMVWVRVGLGTRWSGYEMVWVRDGLGTSWFGYELTRSPMVMLRVERSRGSDHIFY